MSHCTKFAFSYADEELIVKCFQRLGLKPSTEVIARFGSHFSKSILSKIGYAGERQMRAIVAASQGYNYFVCKENSEYTLHIEKGGVISTVDQVNMSKMETEFRLTYVQISLERLAERIQDGGVPTRFVRENNTVTLQFGPSYDRAIRVTASSDGSIEEEVSGVNGPSCASLTSELEALLSLDTAELATRWKPEYTQEIDDQVVQVLRLQN